MPKIETVDGSHGHVPEVPQAFKYIKLSKDNLL